MYAIYINEDYLPFADLILSGMKVWETRNRNMLGKLIGEQVAIVSTSRKRKPLIKGLATITEARHVTPEEYELFRGKTYVPKGSKYDCTPRGKWLYRMSNPIHLAPIPLPEDIIRHGRSWCYIPQYTRIEEVKA